MQRLLHASLGCQTPANLAHTNKPLHQPGRGRRTYSFDFKTQLVAACRIPGMSVAPVAREHGVNHKVLHRLLREVPQPAALGLPHASHEAVPAFIELPIAEAFAAPAVASDTHTTTN